MTTLATGAILGVVRIIEPSQLHNARPRHRLLKLSIYGVASIMIVAITLGSVAYFLPLPVASANTLNIKANAQKVKLTWPSDGQAAVGAVGYGLLAQSGASKSVPMASVAKVMTALSVLRQKPLQSGQAGPIIKLTQADLGIWSSYAAQNGSVVPVEIGETITERQALEAMLLPSANNMADTLATWAFGSVDAYLDYANTLAKSLGLSSTYLADASGFLPATVSTASDLVILGLTAMQNPVLAQIVGESTAMVPVAGSVKNTNYLLGQGVVVGIKTGNTNEAGGCYLLALNHQYGSRKVTIITAILGAPSLYRAMNAGVALANSSVGGFGNRKIVSTGQTVGHYELPNKAQVSTVAAADLNVFSWLAKPLEAQVRLSNLPSGADAGQVTGSVAAAGQSVPVATASSAPAPGWRWRIRRLL